jgi:hypothetical protein
MVESTLGRVVVDEVVSGLPVREFAWYRGRRHYSGWYWSSTMRRHVAYESRLELARILLADFDPDVIAIASQPFQMVGSDGARIRRHVPDLLLVDADGGVSIVDVKPARRVMDADVAAMFEWTRRLVALRGWAFEVWSEAAPCLVENVRFLAGYRRGQLVDLDLAPAVRTAAQHQSTVGGIEQHLADLDPVLVRPVLLHLVWTGELIADLNSPLGSRTTVRLPRLT